MPDEGVKQPPAEMPKDGELAKPPAEGESAQSPADAAAVKANPGEMVDGKPVLHVKVYSPFRTFYDEAAFSLSGENLTGPFDILPRHHNFISLLEPCELLIQSPGGERKIRISGGVMHVKADKATVLLDA